MIKHPNNVGEFVEQIRARSCQGGNQFHADPHPHGINPNALRVMKNGEIHYFKVVYEGPGVAVTDANPNGHYVTIYQPNTSTGHKVGVSDFLNSLDHTFIKERKKRDW